MAKRKLNRRQTWRIEKIQQDKAARARQKESSIDKQLLAGELGDEQFGRVIAHFGSQVEVAVDASSSAIDSVQSESAETNTSSGDDSSNSTTTRYRCFLRANLGSLVTGDRVVFRAGSTQQDVPQGVVESVLERDNELSRPNPYNEIKPVAANIDQILLVIAPEPEAHPNLIDRYLVAAENCHIEPILILNKIDLLDDDDQQRFDELLTTYERLGYRSLKVCSHQPDSLEQLQALLNDKVSVFVGQSGVGKSSLISTLLPGEQLRVGALSENTRKGKHTTTTARLYQFPAGGDLIDSPGIREFGLWHMEAEQVLYGFRDIRPFADQCKFRDCKHDQEPGCVVQQAIADGRLSPLRFSSYQRIVNTLTKL